MWWLTYLTGLWVWVDEIPGEFLKNPSPSTPVFLTIVEEKSAELEIHGLRQLLCQEVMPPWHPLFLWLTVTPGLPKLSPMRWLIPHGPHCTVSPLSCELDLFIIKTIESSKVLNSFLLNEWKNNMWDDEQCRGFVFSMGRKLPMQLYCSICLGTNGTLLVIWLGCFTIIICSFYPLHDMEKAQNHSHLSWFLQPLKQCSHQ